MADDMDPIDDALAERDKVAAKRKADDIQTWKTWKQNPTPENMDALVERFNPVIDAKTRMWRGPKTNQPAMRTNLLINAGEAFETYDPNRGAALRTHLENKLQRSHRFNIQHQNYGYMPEGQVRNISKVEQAKDMLREELGRDPTPFEVANKANQHFGLTGRKKLTEKRVDRITSGQRADIAGSSFESDPTPFAINREREVAGLLRHELDQDHQQLFDHLYGKNGKPQVTSTTQLAKMMGKSPSQVSRMKTHILNKFNSNL